MYKNSSVCFSQQKYPALRHCTNVYKIQSGFIIYSEEWHDVLLMVKMISNLLFFQDSLLISNKCFTYSIISLLVFRHNCIWVGFLVHNYDMISIFDIIGKFLTARFYGGRSKHWKNKSFCNKFKMLFVCFFVVTQKNVSFL